MATRQQQVKTADPAVDRMQTLVVPLAIGVVLIGATAALFRPAYTVNAPITATVAAPARPAADKDIADARLAQKDIPQAAEPLTTGRSVDVKISLPADEVSRMVTRAKGLIDTGDFAAARLLLNRAADAGDAGAIFTLASTYDPNVLSAKGARGLVGDPGQAKALYARALAAGMQDAKPRMNALGG